MSILLKIIKLPLKLIVMSAALILFLINVACTIVICIGSIFTNLAVSLFFFGAAAEWIAGAPDVMAYQCLGLELFFLIAPRVANWLVDKVVSAPYWALSIIRR